MTTETPKTSARDHEFAAFKEFMEEFAGESDRAAVVLAAAKLDVLLYQFLQKVLRPSTSKSDELLDNEAPISTFSARITLAHRLGLIDDLFCRTLHLIRRIRNSCAHELHGAHLESGPHRDRIKDLFGPLEGNNNAEWLITRFLGGDRRPGALFRCVVGICCARLEGAVASSACIAQEPIDFVPPNYPEGTPASAPPAAGAS